MPGDIQKNTLLVVSDTAMYRQGKQVLAYEPVLHELESIADLFDEIIWIGACVSEPRRSMSIVTGDKFKTILLPNLSRKNKWNFLFVLLAYPVIIFQVLKCLNRVKYVHSRGPSHPALVSIIISLLDNKRKYIHKYAGDWNKEDIPTTYRLQRNLLKSLRKINIKASVNGKGAHEQENIINIPNPCLSEALLERSQLIGKQKDFSDKLKLLFVGNMMPSKGIIELLKSVRDGISPRFDELIIVGEGSLLQEVKNIAAEIKDLQVTLTGTVSRDQLNDFYAKTQLIILPSTSEGFPKVLAEAAAFGCIPIATSLSGIRSYIRNNENGFLMKDNMPETIYTTLNMVARHNDLNSMSKNAIEMSRLFTYKKYRNTVANIYGFEEGHTR